MVFSPSAVASTTPSAITGRRLSESVKVASIPAISLIAWACSSVPAPQSSLSMISTGLRNTGSRQLAITLCRSWRSITTPVVMNHNTSTRNNIIKSRLNQVPFLKHRMVLCWKSPKKHIGSICMFCIIMRHSQIPAAPWPLYGPAKSLLPYGDAYSQSVYPIASAVS